MKTFDALSQIDSLLDSLALELERGFSAAWLDYLKVAATFHHYSYANQMLIYAQRPNASRVAGFHKWKELGRFVKKGAKGIAILAPTYKKAQVETTDAAGNETTEEVKLRRFRAVYVFDVADTEALPDAPVIDWKAAIGSRGDGTPEQYAALKAFAESLGVPVRIENTGSAGGYTDGQTIVLERECFGTLAHELGHVLCQFRTGRLDGMTNEERELEAESVAYAVCTASGIDRSEGARNYILNWKGDAKKLRAHATHIQKAVAEILSGIVLPDHHEQHAEAA